VHFLNGGRAIITTRQVTTKVTLFSSLGTWFIAFIAMFSSLAQGTKGHKKTSLKMHCIQFVGGYLKYSPLHYGIGFCQKNLFLIASHSIFSRQNPKKI
jgi:hypothetical protein